MTKEYRYSTDWSGFWVEIANLAIVLVPVAIFGVAVPLSRGDKLNAGGVVLLLLSATFFGYRLRREYVNGILRPKYERIVIEGGRIRHINFRNLEDFNDELANLTSVSPVDFYAGDSTKRWEVHSGASYFEVRAGISDLEGFFACLRSIENIRFLD